MTRSAKDFAAPMIDRGTPPRDRLLVTGASIFANKGFGGGTIREICELAGTSPNMIHHYFGSKLGLYEEILSGFSQHVLEVPLRIIKDPPQSKENLIARIEIFIAETLQALTSKPDVFRMVVREKAILDAFDTYGDRLVRYLKAGQKAGFVRQEIDPEMLTGAILDRLGNQILFATWINEITGEDILVEGQYRKRWLSANIDLLLNGILAID